MYEIATQLMSAIDNSMMSLTKQIKFPLLFVLENSEFYLDKTNLNENSYFDVKRNV